MPNINKKYLFVLKNHFYLLQVCVVLANLFLSFPADLIARLLLPVIACHDLGPAVHLAGLHQLLQALLLALPLGLLQLSLDAGQPGDGVGVARGGEMLEGLRGGGGSVESLGQRDVGRGRRQPGGREEERGRQQWPVMAREGGGFHHEAQLRLLVLVLLLLISLGRRRNHS